jgi:hypothetical protein
MFKFEVLKFLSFSAAHLHEIVFARYMGTETKFRNTLNAASGKRVRGPVSKINWYIYIPDVGLSLSSLVPPGEYWDSTAKETAMAVP